MIQEHIQKIAHLVQQEMEDLCAAHDFYHIERVVKNAQMIYEGEKRWDIHIILAWAYLHEALDEKFFPSESISQRTQDIQNSLKELWLSEEESKKILFIVENVGFWKSLERWDDFEAPDEFYIVEDADRLESVGAIAIARTFTYGGKKGRPIYDPLYPPRTNLDKEAYYAMRETEYKNTSLNHFDEKLFLIKDLMHTETAKNIAQPRHEFMKLFVEQFLGEWEGIK